MRAPFPCFRHFLVLKISETVFSGKVKILRLWLYGAIWNVTSPFVLDAFEIFVDRLFIELEFWRRPPGKTSYFAPLRDLFVKINPEFPYAILSEKLPCFTVYDQKKKGISRAAKLPTLVEPVFY